MTLEQQPQSASPSVRYAFERYSLHSLLLTVPRAVLMSYSQFSDLGSSDENKSGFSSSGSSSTPLSLSLSQASFAVSQSLQQWEIHMQGPELDISYSDDDVQSKHALCCRPAPPYNDFVPPCFYFLVFALPSEWRKSKLVIPHSFSLLEQMHIILSFCSQLYLQSPAVLLRGSPSFCIQLRTAVFPTFIKD